MAAGTRCPACGLLQMPGPTCKSCGRALGGLPQPLGSRPDSQVAGAKGAYEKIGGWLVLLAIGLVLNPIRLLVIMGRDFLPLFLSGGWSVLTTPGTTAYHPLWAPVLMFEIGGNTALLGFSVLVAVFFFQKRKLLPRLMIAFLLVNFLLVAADYFVADLLPSVASQKDPEATMELARALIAGVIWVPYFVVSKRVKRTFVR
jgi:hypothetical protein